MTQLGEVDYPARDRATLTKHEVQENRMAAQSGSHWRMGFDPRTRGDFSPAFVPGYCEGDVHSPWTIVDGRGGIGIGFAAKGGGACL